LLYFVRGENCYHRLVTKTHTHGVGRGRYYPPMLYPQASDVRSVNITLNSTWYATSAFMDMRPQSHGLSPDVAIVSAGPYFEVRAGATWFARIFFLRTTSIVVELKCDTTLFSDTDIWGNVTGYKRAVTIVNCPTARAWENLMEITDELGVCLVHSLDKSCDVVSIVPIGIPPLYPKPHLPLSHDSQIRGEINAVDDYLKGKGAIAMCVSGVRGDLYANSFTFFLKYYGKLGVDTVHMYMHSPGNEFTKLVDSIISHQGSGSLRDFPRLIVLPWCMQRGASYGCRRGHPIKPIPLSEMHDFAGTNWGQLLAQQDCLFRSMGEYRWVLFADLDEYMLPRIPELRNLQDIIQRSINKAQNLAPAEIAFHTAFYESCLPSASDNGSVPLLPDINVGQFSTLPKPAWSPARVSTVYPIKTKAKYMCDPLACDRVGVHYVISKVCDRYKNTTKQARWPASCKKGVVTQDDAINHHVRVRNRNGSEDFTTCNVLYGVHELDWGMTNFASEVGLME
jgi:hypothetical protein